MRVCVALPPWPKSWPPLVFATGAMLVVAAFAYTRSIAQLFAWIALGVVVALACTLERRLRTPMLHITVYEPSNSDRHNATRAAWIRVRGWWPQLGTRAIAQLVGRSAPEQACEIFVGFEGGHFALSSDLRPDSPVLATLRAHLEPTSPNRTNAD